MKRDELIEKLKSLKLEIPEAEKSGEATCYPVLAFNAGISSAINYIEKNWTEIIEGANE